MDLDVIDVLLTDYILSVVDVYMVTLSSGLFHSVYVTLGL